MSPLDKSVSEEVVLAHVSNTTFYKARKSKILQQKEIKSEATRKFYKNETKSEAARNILQQRDQIRDCKKGGIAAGISNQI